MRRKAAVAGYFYPQREKELRKMIRDMVDPGKKKEKSIGVVSPHAGYVYSGPVAGAVFSSVQLPERFVILGPSHRGMASRIAIMREGVWEMPFGDVPVDSELADLITKSSGIISEDSEAHLHEHSLEVQLPFIQFFKQNFSIVPVCVASSAAFEELEELGKAIARAAREKKQEVMVVASTDMSHYIQQEIAEKKDFMAINKILELDAKGLYEVVSDEGISMCGFQPTTSAVVACKALGASSAELIKYQTSGDITGDYSEVVGYSGIRIK
ncbi:MAG: AmmeMemoRadiSam system protein B [Candidatus Aminicenantes bacterium]